MIKRRFIAGLLIWLPLGGTILIINFLLGFFDKIWIFVPLEYQPEYYLGYSIPGLSVILSFLLIYITGYIFSNYFGSKLLHFWELVLSKIPGIRSFYKGIKQMTEAIFVSGNSSFKKVFLIEYPRKGLWTVAFETSEIQGSPHRLISKRDGVQDLLINLFVPTTPNPTSGYFIIADKADLIELNMKVDDALKMIVSGGVFVPDERRIEHTEKDKNKQ